MDSPPKPENKQWSLPVSLLFIAVVLPLMFFVKFGYLDGYSYGFTGFLLLLTTAVHYIPLKSEELTPYSEASLVKPSRFDFLGVIWLLSIPFAPFFGWVIANFTDLNLDNWRLLLSIQAGLCVALPVICVLPLLRYVRGRPAAFALAVLAGGTLFPVLTGLGAARDVLYGPQWEDVEVTSLQDINFRDRTIRVSIPRAFVHLTDGRRLTHTERVDPEVGPARMLILRGTRHILAIK